MNGILIVNKPQDFTSRDVVNKLNHIFHTKKIGHTGTLDPIATGVLVCVIGSYTKLVNELTSLDKEYIAEIKLGIKTDTGDITGNVVEEKKFNISLEDIIKVFNSFPKEYEQTVPKYSAIKINGKKLYEYARENIDIDLPKRLVHIYSLELLEYNDNVIKFKTSVSKGTYIRSLIEDLCKSLNVVGTMSSLVRTKQGIFEISSAVDLDKIDIDTKLYDCDQIFNVKNISLDDALYKLVTNGNKLHMDIEDGYYNVIYDGKKIALYKFKYNEGRIIMFY